MKCSSILTLHHLLFQKTLRMAQSGIHNGGLYVITHLRRQLSRGVLRRSKSIDSGPNVHSRHLCLSLGAQTGQGPPLSGKCGRQNFPGLPILRILKHGALQTYHRLSQQGRGV